MKNLAIIQARFGSTRLPGKVLMDLAGSTVLERVIERVKKSQLIDEVVVATTIKREDLPIVSLCSSKGVRVFCGSETDVLDRYYQVAKLLRPDHVIRITADCPLLDTDVLDKVIRNHMESRADYTSNTLDVTYPDGLDCEIMKYAVLEEAWLEAKMTSQREHVTQYIIHSDNYKKTSVTNPVNYSSERWTIDTPEDYKLIGKIYGELGKDNTGFETVLKLLDKKQELKNINSKFARNEGLEKSLANDHEIK